MTCVGAFTVPRDLAEALEGEGRVAWLAGLPGTVRELAKRWSLGVGEPFQPGGSTAWVALVVDAVGTELVLKVVCRHTEAAHEADG
jgi:streptomycin 6-kinase